MNLRELGYLVALADLKHFRRAAEACHVSQPTLSTQIKKLEEFLGVELFERTNKSVRITEIGQDVLALARQILADADAIIDLTRREIGLLDGPLTLGIIPTLCPYLLPWFIPPLKLAYPKLRLTIREDLTDHLVEQLADHQIDAAILSLPIAREGIESLSLFDEPFWFACSKTHVLSAETRIDNDRLRKEPLLLLTDGHCLRDQMLAVCDADRPQGDSDNFRAASLESIRQMVAAGMGCTLLPALAIDKADDNGTLTIRPLANDASREIGLVWRRSYSKANDLKLIADVLLNNLPETVTASAHR